VRPKFQGDVFFQFIQPCHKQRAKTVPNGEEWQHEIKFDGFIQIHKLGNEVELYSRNGSRFSRRFPRLVGVLRRYEPKTAFTSALNCSGETGLIRRRPRSLTRSTTSCSQEPVRNRMGMQ
jgi:hypothetical protein